MSKKIIVSDLDGTLFNSDVEDYDVSQELIAKVKEFQGQGNIFTIATGRPVETSIGVAEKIGINAPYIAYNGAKIVTRDGSEIYSENFKFEVLKEFLKDIERHNISVVFYDNGQVFTLKHNERIKKYELKEKTKCSECNDENINNERIVNKILLIGNIKIIEEAWSRWDNNIKSSFRYVISEDDYFEIVKKNVSKGSALKKLKQYLNIEDGYYISIGNHMNDKELLEEGNESYAVNNAVEDLKTIADFVTYGDYEKGVIEVIEKFI